MDLVKKLFPIYSLKRELASKQLKSLSRAYDGAVLNDFYSNPLSAASANADTLAAGETLRNKARSFDENLDLVVGIFDTLVQNVVGNYDPIRPMVRSTSGELNSKANENISRLWKEWGVSPTTCGQYTMLQTLKLACRAWLRDGEFLTRLHVGGASLLSLELIDADYLPFDKNEDRNGLVVQGVEIDKFNRPIAYHLYKDFPGDSWTAAIGSNTTRVPASDIVHLKFSRRSNQIRGITILHSVMNRLEDLKDYEESERIAARVAAATTGFIQKSGEPLGTLDNDGARKIEMSPGMIYDNLLPGETVNTIASNRPNPELTNWRATQLRAIASGVGVNYSTIAKDYNGTYSSQRQELLESKPAYESLRQQFVDQYISPLWRTFISIQVAAGNISQYGIDAKTIDDIEMRSLDIGWIDPKKQADAIEISLRNKIISRQQVIRDRGGNPAAVFSEIEEEAKLFPEQVEQTGDSSNAKETERDKTDDTES